MGTLEKPCHSLMDSRELVRLIADLKRLPKDERLMLLAVLLQS